MPKLVLDRCIDVRPLSGGLQTQIALCFALGAEDGLFHDHPGLIIASACEGSSIQLDCRVSGAVNIQVEPETEKMLMVRSYDVCTDSICRGFACVALLREMKCGYCSIIV
jgi:hypothetical protein